MPSVSMLNTPLPNEYMCRLPMHLRAVRLSVVLNRCPSCFNMCDPFIICTKLGVFDGSNRVLLFSAFGSQMLFQVIYSQAWQLSPSQTFPRCEYFYGSGTFTFQKGMCDASLGKHYQIRVTFLLLRNDFLTIN